MRKEEENEVLKMLKIQESMEGQRMLGRIREKTSRLSGLIIDHVETDLASYRSAIPDKSLLEGHPLVLDWVRRNTLIIPTADFLSIMDGQITVEEYISNSRWSYGWEEGFGAFYCFPLELKGIKDKGKICRFMEKKEKEIDKREEYASIVIDRIEKKFCFKVDCWKGYEGKSAIVTPNNQKNHVIIYVPFGTLNYLMCNPEADAQAIAENEIIEVGVFEYLMTPKKEGYSISDVDGIEVFYRHWAEECLSIVEAWKIEKYARKKTLFEKVFRFK